LTILVNDHAIAIPPRGTNGYDDDDQWLVARTVDVPLDELNDGPNDIRLDFDTAGGMFVTATLLIEESADLAGQ
ncbi:MAG: hypothetical protein AAF743_02305, partial [Planctomycetota bacterium]